MRKISRRTFLKTATVTTVGVGALSVPAAAHEPPRAHPILCELDMNGQFDVENHRVADPATNADLCAGDASAVTESDRENVLHVTSNGNSTRDYSSGIVNIEDRFDGRISLEEVSSSGDVAFNYFEGPDNENAAPDEVFLIVRKGDSSAGTLSDSGLFAAYKTINDGIDPDPRDVSCEDDNKTWRGVDVSSQMTGGDRGWADISISEEVIESGQMVIETARSLRDREDRFESILDRYGTDSELVAVGYGKGSTRQETTIDAYYDNLIVRRSDENVERLDFPAAIPMDVEFEGPREGSLTVSLSLQQEEEFVDLEDVQGNSVKLTQYVPVSPPVEEGGSASSVDVTGDGLEVEFPANEVANLLGGQEPVIVAGRFDNDADDVFVAQGRIRDRGDKVGSFSPFQ